MKTLFWWFWIVLTLLITAYYGYKILYAEDKTELLIGETTYGHYQIEMSCSTCHTEAFGGGEVIQEACVQCHGAVPQSPYVQVARRSRPSLCAHPMAFRIDLTRQ